MMTCLTKNNISTSFSKTTVILKCGECNKEKELPSLEYFKKWGYPKGEEKQSVAEWLHKQEKSVICPYCKYEAEFMTSKEFYGKDYGTNIWVCHSCEAYVGTHGKSKNPLGTLANKETREWRKQAHKYVDPLWKSKKMKRGEVYRWIQKVMAMTPQEAHIGNFNVEQCKKIIRKVGEEMQAKIKIDFIDITNGNRLGTSAIPMTAIRQLKVGDRVEFKDVGAVFGMMEIVQFTVNEGYPKGSPEGSIHLKPVKSKGKIKLQEINDEYVDSLLPF